jgi:hypothetical protein
LDPGPLDFASVDRVHVEVRFEARSQGESVSIDSVRTVP